MPETYSPSRSERKKIAECGRSGCGRETKRAKKYSEKNRFAHASRYTAIRPSEVLSDIPALPASQEVVVAHTSRVVTTAQASREWDAMTRPPTRTMVHLPPD
jgi:hypothetical protein